ncbi:hypothetical protein PRIPAC_76743, partial [Pristionchus pacificus]|uniref:Uncharacterized protein n=1 Tax=Pristionchus pacificus TaxID=54126 RepID=A0A2A6BW63_PRIPA
VPIFSFVAPSRTKARLPSAPFSSALWPLLVIPGSYQLGRLPPRPQLRGLISHVVCRFVWVVLRPFLRFPQVRARFCRFISSSFTTARSRR